MREVNPTRSAALELADERKLMRQGYEFLDEKRMLLATEMLRQLRGYQQVCERLMAETKAASDALAAAVERHGFDQLQVYPVSAPPPPPQHARSRFLCIAMLASIAPSASSAPAAAAVDPSPEAKACRIAFARLLQTTVDLALRAGNLHRLAREYRRTTRRAHAIQDVLLPEVSRAAAAMEASLEEQEREEALWARRGAGR